MDFVRFKVDNPELAYLWATQKSGATMRPCPCTSTAHTSVKYRFPTCFIRVLLISSFRKVVRNPSLKPILVRIGKKFAETIILSIFPRFCNLCTALTVPLAIAWLQLVVHHPMNSGIPFHKQYIIYRDKNLWIFESCFCLSGQVSRIDKYKETCYNSYKYSKRPR